MKLVERIKQERFYAPAQQSYINVIVTSNWLLGEMAAVMAPHGMTIAQYNVLRVLRGSHPTPLTCSQIGERLLDRTPDVTRLLNRLERSAWIARTRAAYDRRVVEVQITEAGLELLGRMEEPVEGKLRHLTRHLSPEEHRTLSELLERMRTDEAY